MSNNLIFDRSTNVLTVPAVTGVEYRIGSRVVEGDIHLTKTTTVNARPKRGFVFARGSKTEFEFFVSQIPDEPEVPESDPHTDWGFDSSGEPDEESLNEEV